MINHCSQGKRQSAGDGDTSTVSQSEPIKTVKLDLVLRKCDKEGVDESMEVEQPLFIDESVQKIKCSWCPTWVGANTTKVVNQHIRKAVSHQLTRIQELNLPQPESQGVQTDIRTFF